MGKAERARSYLGAHMTAANEELGAEHREAARVLMRNHEREDPTVRERALAGADEDFDRPLSAGERAAQRRWRSEEGLSEGQLREMRSKLRGEKKGPSPKSPRPQPRPSTPSLPAIGDIWESSPAQSSGQLLLEAGGVGLTLILLYLLTAGKGSGVFSGLLNFLSGALGKLIEPLDPLAPASPAAPHSLASSASAGPAAPPYEVRLSAAQALRQRSNLRPSFGPAPGISPQIGGIPLTVPYGG